MNFLVGPVLFSVLVISANAAPQGDYPRSSVLYEDLGKGRKANDVKAEPAQISHFEQSQTPEKSEFRYVDTDGNSRWETVVYQIVKDGDKEVVVPLATGGHEYTHGGIKIVQTYTSGVKGTSFSTVWDGKPKKGQ